MIVFQEGTPKEFFYEKEREGEGRNTKNEKILELLKEKLSISLSCPPSLSTFEILQRDVVVIVISIDAPPSPSTTLLNFQNSAGVSRTMARRNASAASADHEESGGPPLLLLLPRARSNQTVTYFPYGISFKNSEELTRAGEMGEMKQMRRWEDERGHGGSKGQRKGRKWKRQAGREKTRRQFRIPRERSRVRVRFARIFIAGVLVSVLWLSVVTAARNACAHARTLAQPNVQ